MATQPDRDRNHLNHLSFDNDQVLHIPKEMGLLNLRGRLLVDGRAFNGGIVDLYKRTDPKAIVTTLGLSSDCIQTKIVIPAGRYGEALQNGDIAISQLFRLFRGLAQRISNYPNISNETVRTRVRAWAHFYLMSLQDQMMRMTFTVYNTDVIGGRAPSSLIGRIINSPTIPYYCISLPRDAAESVKIKQGDRVIAVRWPVLRAVRSFEVMYWDEKAVGLPPSAFSAFNGDVDGDLIAVAKIPKEITSQVPDPIEWESRYAQYTGEFLIPGVMNGPKCDGISRISALYKTTNGSSLGPANLLGELSVLDRFMISAKGAKKYAPRGFIANPMNLEQHWEAMRRACQNLGLMKALIGLVGKTRRGLTIALQDDPKATMAICRAFEPIEQGTIDGGKQDVRIDWAPVDTVLNRGQDYEGKQFGGTQEEYIDLLADAMKTATGTAPDMDDIRIIVSGLYQYAGFPHLMGLNDLIASYYPMYAFFQSMKSGGQVPRRATECLLDSMRPTIPSQANI